MMNRNKASFRDPSGFVYRDEGILLRQVNLGYRKDYEALMEGGLIYSSRKQG